MAMNWQRVLDVVMGLLLFLAVFFMAMFGHFVVEGRIP